MARNSIAGGNSWNASPSLSERVTLRCVLWPTAPRSHRSVSSVIAFSLCWCVCVCVFVCMVACVCLLSPASLPFSISLSLPRCHFVLCSVDPAPRSHRSVSSVVACSTYCCWWVFLLMCVCMVECVCVCVLSLASLPFLPLLPLPRRDLALCFVTKCASLTSLVRVCSRSRPFVGKCWCVFVCVCVCSHARLCVVVCACVLVRCGLCVFVVPCLTTLLSLPPLLWCDRALCSVAKLCLAHIAMSHQESHIKLYMCVSCMFCLSGCLSVRLLVCLCVCLSVFLCLCLAVCLLVCRGYPCACLLSACLSVSLLVVCSCLCLCLCLRVYMFVGLFMSVCVFAYHIVPAVPDTLLHYVACAGLAYIIPSRCSFAM